MPDTMTYKILDRATCGAHGVFLIQVDGPGGPFRNAVRMPEAAARKTLLEWARDKFPGVELVDLSDERFLRINGCVWRWF